ncbi:hypothetical protein [Bacteroides timonensis]|uniref:hypothetical protein n=1 Tax=Bacteroides timonensis TaxID=1470345 RepID=UPI0004B305D8|nr:hypothetical protein [Bacteroides timonensis]
MKVDLNRVFKDYKGLETENVISDKVAEALYSAGITPEFAIKREYKFRAYKISKSIIDNNGVVELSSEDISLIKEICSNFFTAGAYGQVHEILEA